MCSHALQFFQRVPACKCSSKYHIEQVSKFLEILILLILGQFFVKLFIHQLYILFLRKSLC